MTDSDVISLDARRPHFRVQGGSADGAQICEYVFAEKLAIDVASGEAPISAIPEAVWQTIIREWIDYHKTKRAAS